jgi:hypothetical protein
MSIHISWQKAIVLYNLIHISSRQLCSTRKGTNMPSERTSRSKSPSPFHILKSNIVNYHFFMEQEQLRRPRSLSRIPYTLIFFFAMFTKLPLTNLSGGFSSEERSLILRCKLNHILRCRYKGLIDNNHWTLFSFQRTRVQKWSLKQLFKKNQNSIILVMNLRYGGCLRKPVWKFSYLNMQRWWIKRQ